MNRTIGQAKFGKGGILLLPFYFCLFTCLNFAQTLAPGAPGKDAQWSSAGKQAIGTSANLKSKIWFTLQGGALTEVYYPDVTVANVHKLQFIVVNTKTKKVETETEDAVHKIEAVNSNSLSFRQTNTAKSGEWEIIKEYTVDPERNSVLINVLFRPWKNIGSHEIYVYYDPSLGNTGMHDTGWTQDNSLLASDKDKASALISTNGFTKLTNGFLGTSDGLTQLRKSGQFQDYNRAENGNVVQVGLLKNSQIVFKNYYNFSLALGFGKTSEEAWETAKQSSQKGFQKSFAEYEKGWSDYVKTIPKVEAKYQAQFNMAAMVMRAQEDKTVRGANVASLTIPWGGGANANEDIGGGYHLVWSRDLYQVVTAYMALGDTAAANRALDFLFDIQQKPDGSFPQNSWLDGKQGWGSLQLDEVAYPLIMAYQLKRFDKKTYENHVKKAADFLVKTGPKTPQERWEEKSGYSPSTIAAEIAGLVCAADIAKRNGDETSAVLYLKIADDWAANVEKWTATTNGKYGDGNYYVRLTENGKPDEREKTVLSNNAGTAIENEIVDAGFLELVRLGIKSPDDPLIVKSVKVIDQTLKVKTPNGESFYRYTNDGYGEMDDGRRWNWDGKYTGKGRLWALLAGERGQYELALSDLSRTKVAAANPDESQTKAKEQFDWKVSEVKNRNEAQLRLEAMANFANEGLMIAEQIWDKAETPENIDKQFVPELKFGEGTGSATPLAWSMAQFIRLAVNLQAGKNLDTPDIVYNRYVLGKKDSRKAENQQSAELLDIPCSQEYNLIKMTFKAHYPADSNGKTAEFKIDRSPVIWKNKAIFFLENEQSKINLAGDFSNWKPTGQDFQKVPSTNLQCFQMKFAPTARIEYKIIVDGKWLNDPLNPNKIDNGVGGENSFFTMPEYKSTIWDKEIKEFNPTLQTIEINSKVFGEIRKVQVYAPPVSTQSPYRGVLYLQDGGDYIKRAKALEIYENLVSAKKVSPFILVFIDYKDRMKEYWASNDYAKFLAEEVVPVIDSKYRTVRSREGRAILGASLGGITSVHTALKYPEIFARVGGQSSSFWIDNERVVRELEMLDSSKNKFKFYFDDGTLEGVNDSRKVNEILRGKGYDVSYLETEAGHNWTAWRDRLANAFIALWQ